jgi:hypothetical protein
LIEADKSGERKYIDICNQTGVIPVSYFIRHIQDKEFQMRYHGLGPLGAKAIALPLKVCLDRNKMKTKHIRLSKQYQKSTNAKNGQD